MPHEWNNIIVVTKEELVPKFYNTYSALKVSLFRYSAKAYGIKRVRLGGNGRTMLIAFDSLPENIKQAIGDPRKADSKNLKIDILKIKKQLPHGTQTEIAKKCKVTVCMVNRVLNGKVYNLKVLNAVADFLKDHKLRYEKAISRLKELID